MREALAACYTNMILWIILFMINLLAFTLMAWDKRRAQQKRTRVRESTLWLCAVCMGALGMLLGMKKCRHKTLHRHFVIGLPCLIALQIMGLSTGWLYARGLL